MGIAEYTHLPEYIAIRVSRYLYSVARLEPQTGAWKTPDYRVIETKLTKTQAEETLRHLQTRPDEAVEIPEHDPHREGASA